MTAIYERRYHAAWMAREGRSALSDLATWLCIHRGDLKDAPHDLLAASLNDVTARLPAVAAREPTRRHKKHFFWLLKWCGLIAEALGTDDRRV